MALEELPSVNQAAFPFVDIATLFKGEEVLIYCINLPQFLTDDAPFNGLKNTFVPLKVKLYAEGVLKAQKVSKRL